MKKLCSDCQLWIAEPSSRFCAKCNKQRKIAAALLDFCNNCDAAPAALDSAAGYCAACMSEVAR